MSYDDLVPLRCRPETLERLEAGLLQFGPAGGAPDWLTSAVWLCTGETRFVATGAVQVLSDGYVARPLDVRPADQLLADLEEDLADIPGRLSGHGTHFELPPADEIRIAPGSLKEWTSEGCSMRVLVRLIQKASTSHRVGCGLLFTGDGRSLLVGTDSGTLAIVLSEDPELIERYVAGCLQLSLGDYWNICRA